MHNIYWRINYRTLLYYIGNKIIDDKLLSDNTRYFQAGLGCNFSKFKGALIGSAPTSSDITADMKMFTITESNLYIH